MIHMKTRYTIWLCAAELLLGLSVRSAEPALESHLEPFRPLLEKTWKGQFKDSKPEHPTVDVAHWERALNGTAVRVTHSINDGLYGGEILMFWNDRKQQLEYYYFTTAGFMTTGTVRFEQGKFITHEYVSGSKEGTTEVHGTSELSPDGGFHVKSEYLKNGQWVAGHEVTYREALSAKVIFR
jgi:hypothetical protein